MPIRRVRRRRPGPTWRRGRTRRSARRPREAGGRCPHRSLGRLPSRAPPGRPIERTPPCVRLAIGFREPSRRDPGRNNLSRNEFLGHTGSGWRVSCSIWRSHGSSIDRSSIERGAPRRRTSARFGCSVEAGRAAAADGAILSHTEPTLLLTNDDGWDAPGLEALRQAAAGLGQCRVIAPSGPISGCGHRVTTHGPIVVTAPTAGDSRRGRHTGRLCAAGAPSPRARGRAGFSPGSTPAATWARTFITPGPWRPCAKRSSTVSRESPCRSTSPGARPSTGLERRGGPRRPAPADGQPWEPGTFWNVNLPHLAPEDPEPEVVFCPLDPSPLPLAYRVEGARPSTRATTSIASPPAGMRRRRLLRRADRRDLDPRPRRDFDPPSPERPDRAAIRSNERPMRRRSGRRGRRHAIMRFGLSPTRRRARAASRRKVTDAGHPAVELIIRHHVVASAFR